MAAKQVVKKSSTKFWAVKTLSAATILISCLVCLIGGVMHGARTGTIIINCGFASTLIIVVSWFVVKVLSSYEEMNSGKA